MRDIKFRAWDTKEKVMFDEFGTNRDINKFFANTGSWKLLQYTGLKDKNGVEIYESDYLEHPDGSYGYVVWNQEVCGFLLGSGPVFGNVEWYEKTGWEVRGNKYERNTNI